MKHLSELAGRMTRMSDAERIAVAERLPVVLTVEGHPLSVRNSILLHWQSTAAPTLVGGFKQWIGAGRCVCKGEKALYILHPCARKAEGDGDDKADLWFREAAVFDITQTCELGAVKADPAPVSAPVAAPTQAPVQHVERKRESAQAYYSEEFTQL